MRSVPGGHADEGSDGGRYREHRYRWRWELAASPEQLWPLIADTNRFDRDTGVPAVALRPPAVGDDDLGNGRIAVTTRQYGVRLDYTQEPFEWEEPRWLRVRRTFHTGPLATLGVDLELTPREGGGTAVDYEVRARARNVLGLSIPLQIGVIFARRFARVASRFDELAVAGAAEQASGRAPRLGRTGRVRLDEGARALRAGGGDPALVDRLSEVVASADDVVAARLRPYELADRWGADRGVVLDLFLRATRAGIVGFRWDVLCPLCRVAKASTTTLRDLPGTVHCDTCHVDSTANFARSVELTFRPSPAVRAVADDDYCIGSPSATPHVVAQAVVPAGDGVVLRPVLEPGRYRLRALGVPGGCYVRVRRGGPIDAATALGPAGWPDVELDVGTAPALVVRVEGEERLVLLERTAWGDAAVTAAEVTARQEFRDLFADEALRPGEQVSVGSMTIVFTDLVGSTRLYRDIGDAVAFGRVLDHFDVLRECIVAEGGAVVKTIGDAVMAVFPAPAAALRSLRSAQARLAAAGDDPALRLKAGIHHGPCLGVTLNGQLDYFGTTVNFAARLEGQSGGEAIVVSDAVHDDPEVQAVLASSPDLVAVPLTPDLKGFDAGARVWRLSTL